MRYEFKYIVPNFRLDALRSALLPFVKLDKFAAKQPNKEYTVRSIYFDTPKFEMYHTKREHLAHRMKVRLRAYNTESGESPVFLEIKRKYEGPILKNRATLPYSSVKKIFSGASIEDFLPMTNKADNVRRFFFQIHSRHLRPVVNVVYEREPFLSNIVDLDNDMRISFDKNLRSIPYPTVDELFVEKKLRYPLEGHFILEVKFNKYCPAWLKPIISDFEFQKTPASKYVMCIDSQNEINTEKTNQSFFMGKFMRRPFHQ